MEKVFYAVGIIFVVAMFVLVCMYVSRKNTKISQDLIAKNKARIELEKEAENQIIESEKQKELLDANLENFVLFEEEKQEKTPTLENDFEYEKFVDDNMIADPKFDFDFDAFEDDMQEETPKPLNFKDIFVTGMLDSQKYDEE